MLIAWKISRISRLIRKRIRHGCCLGIFFCGGVAVGWVGEGWAAAKPGKKDGMERIEIWILVGLQE